MSKIKLLSSKTINQIAAGEVIDRPTSVIKELVENAIDAGADEIIVELERGGRNLIAVHDNGCGMGANDLLMAIERHATSKLDEDDISHIINFGFRGEALPSIGSIAKLTITSKTEDAETACMLTIEADNKPFIHPATRKTGTTVEVRDIFCFTPARLKFLKSENSEKACTVDLTNRFLLSHPTCGFKLIYDGKIIINVAKNDSIEERVTKVIGTAFIKNSVPFMYIKDDIKIHGYAGFPTFNHGTAVHNYVFVNHRSVKDKYLISAIRGAYQGLVPNGRHPAIILFIDLNPYDVDVNVHPAKAEVRFREAEKIRSMIVNNIRQAVRTAEFNSYKSEVEDVSQQSQTLKSYAPTFQSKTSSYVFIPQASKDLLEGVKTEYVAPKAPAQQENIFEDYPLGYAKFQLGNKYIVAENSKGLILLDQHAAHERITLQKFKEQLKDGPVKSQMLVIAHIETLGIALTIAIIDSKELLKDLGLLIEQFGNDAVSVSAIPSLLIGLDVGDLIRDIAEQINEYSNQSVIANKQDEILGNFACHYSIRSGRKMSLEEMNNLLRDVEKTDFASQCNHGRPTFKRITMKELDSMFERS